MSIRLVLFVLSVVYFINSISSREVIQRLHSPRITNWGKWGGLEFCPQNSYVGGMNLKIQVKQGAWRDDSGLNAIQLQCVTMDWNYQGKITSLTGSSGNYRNVKYCPKGFATGFQLRSEPPQGSFKDDAGAVDFILRCTNFDGTTSYVRSDQGSLKFGKWTQEQSCPPRSAVCGIATQVEDKGGKDDTALNNVDLACCKIPNPAETCKLEKKWQTVKVCPKAGNECEMNFTTGFVQNKYEKLSKYYKSLGFIVDFKFVQKVLKRKAKKYGSKTINDKYPEYIINETQIEQKHWSDRLNCEGIIQQLVFTCGQFKVYTKEYRCVPRVVQGKEYRGGLYFQPSTSLGKILWSYNCEFNGRNIANKKSQSEDCGEICYENSECTHFTWTTHDGGTCWMRGVGVSITPDEIYDKNLICGWIERPKNKM